jgi:hypothetical protein
MFTGRTLSATALEMEQNFRAGLLALHGELFSPGIVQGLVAGFSPDGKFLELTPGLGLAAGGELLAVPQAQTVPVVQIQGVAAGVGVLVLKPVEYKIIGTFDAGDSCDYDPAKDAFADWQLIEGAVLTFIPWPADLLGAVPAKPQQRSLLAYAIFRQEAGMGPQTTFPWEDAGLPLALVGLNPDLTPSFIDRAAVVREGGTPLRRTPIIRDSGHPSLWQAQLMQFGEQLAGFDFNTLDKQDCSAVFAALPPVGLLPPEAFTFAFSSNFGAIFQNRFFPPFFQLTVAPVPLEQLDAAIERAAPLDPIDTGAPETVEILVPVPQPFYEPNLLVAEQVDPVFNQELQAAIQRRAEWLKRRLDVRAAYSGINKEIAGQGFPFPDPDPNRLEPSEFVAAAVADDPQDHPAASGRDQILADHDAKILDPLTRALGSEASAKDFAVKTRSRGMLAAIDELQAVVDKGDDVINLGFLRAQTDMYRLRQLLLGGTAASRLATSPALAGIVEARTAVAQETAIQAAFADMKANKMTARETRSVKFVDMQSLMFMPQDTGADQGIVTSDVGDAPAMFTAAPVFAEVAVSRKVSALERFAQAAPSRVATVVGDKQTVPDTGASAGEVPKDPGTTPQDATTTPVTGKQEVRSTTTEERIRAAQAPQARDFALVTKFDILLSLSQAPASLDAKLYPEAGPMLTQAFTNIPIPAVAAFDKGTNAFVFLGDQNVKRATVLFRDMDQAAIARTLQEPDDKNVIDESSFFSAATDIVESVVAILRGAEGRIDAFRDAITVCQSTLDALQNAAHLLDERLSVLEDNLAEARQDISVTRALLADEQQRVDVINQRRERVILEQATFYAFHRPPTVDLLAPRPAHTVDPEVLQPAVPVCLSRALTPPVEIQKLVELLRESPVRWFPAIEKLLDRFEKPPAIIDIVQRASARITAVGSLTLESADFLTVSRGRFGDAIQKVLTAQRSTAMQYRYTLVNFSTAGFAGLSWKTTRDNAGQLLTVGDLIDHSAARQDVSREAARLLDQIGRVPACLHGKFSEVAPDIRLDWALRYSQYDGAVDFRDLSRLPQWSAIDYLDRHEMQTYVDWMFAQVNAQDAEAVTAIDNIIRVAMLLASHAPVDRILQAEIQQAASLSLGSTVPIKFNPAVVDKIGRGLEFNLVRNDVVVGRGVVDDLLGDLANLKLTRNYTTAATLAVDAQVKAVAATSTAAMERRLTMGTASATKAALSGLAARQ